MKKHGHFILQGIFPMSDGYDPVSKQCFQLNAENIQLTKLKYKKAFFSIFFFLKTIYFKIHISVTNTSSFIMT